MATITIVGSTSAQSTNGGNATIALPTYAVGDVAVVAVTLGTSRSTALAVASSSGEAYTQIVSTINSSYARFGVFRKLFTTATQAQAIVTGTAGASDSTTGVIHIFRNVNQTTIEDATPTSTTSNSSLPDSPSITTVSDGCAIITSVGIDIVGAGMTPPSSFLNAVQRSGNDTLDATTGQAWILQTTQGAFNPTTWASTAAVNWCAATIALRQNFVGEGVGFPAGGNDVGIYSNYSFQYQAKVDPLQVTPAAPFVWQDLNTDKGVIPPSYSVRNIRAHD